METHSDVYEMNIEGVYYTFLLSYGYLHSTFEDETLRRMDALESRIGATCAVIRKDTGRLVAFEHSFRKDMGDALEEALNLAIATPFHTSLALYWEQHQQYIRHWLTGEEVPL